MGGSPLLDLVRAGAFIMLLFAAILILVVIRNVEAPIKFGTRIGPLLVGMGLVFFALPIYGDVVGSQFLDQPGSVIRLMAGILLPLGLYLMRPLTPAQAAAERAKAEAAEEPEVEAAGVGDER